MKKNFIDVKGDFVVFLNKQKKLAMLALVMILLLIIGLIIFIPKIQENIRFSEVDSLVKQKELDKKANYLNLKTADQEIVNRTAATVLFSAPDGDLYNKVVAILADKQQMLGFTHSIYIYPIVYHAEKIEEKYNIHREQVTIIFFERGKEKNRLSVDENFELQTMLIPSLNQLPLSSAAVQE